MRLVLTLVVMLTVCRVTYGSPPAGSGVAYSERLPLRSGLGSVVVTWDEVSSLWLGSVGGYDVSRGVDGSVVVELASTAVWSWDGGAVVVDVNGWEGNLREDVVGSRGAELPGAADTLSFMFSAMEYPILVWIFICALMAIPESVFSVLRKHFAAQGGVE